MIYLASLYSNGADTGCALDSGIREQRYQYTMKRLYELMMGGMFVFSPIVHCHEMSKKYDLPKDYTFWQENDRHFISNCDRVVVLKMSDEYGNWEKSKGIQDEIAYAKSSGVPVHYFTCYDYVLD